MGDKGSIFKFQKAKEKTKLGGKGENSKRER